jgi:hypothetical protein
MIEIKNTVNREEKVAIANKFDSNNLYYLLEDKSPNLTSAAEIDMMGHYYHGPYIFKVNEKDIEKATSLLKTIEFDRNLSKVSSKPKTSFVSELITD